MKPKYNTSKLRSANFGASLVTVITVCFGGSAFAVDNNWIGGTVGFETDWNTTTNWSLGVLPTAPDDARISTNTPVATITSTPASNPRDLIVGRGGGNSGQVNHLAGSIATGNGNWAFCGHEGGTGVYNLTNTVPVATGPTGPFSGFGQGSGNLTVGGQFRVGAGGNGTLNVNTTGTITVNSELHVGTDGGGSGTGVMNLDSGAVTNNNWVLIGNEPGSVGTLNMSGGSLFKNGGNRFVVGRNGGTGIINITGGQITDSDDFFILGAGGSTGTINMSGGSITKNGGQHFILGDGGGNTGNLNMSAGTVTINGECWVGQASGTGNLNLSGGTLTNNSWVAIGRDNVNSHGTVNHSGGTWNKTGGGRFIIGDNSDGDYNLSQPGVTPSVLQINDELWIGQGGNGNGTLVMSGGSITSNSWVAVGRDNGTAAVTMTGGTWTKTGGGNYILGANGTCVMDMSGGLVDVQGGYTWIGEGNNRPATLNFSGTAEFRTSTMSVGQSTNGTLNLNGGIMRTQRFIGAREADDTGNSGGNCVINFNGTEIIATANNTLNFISTTVDTANIGNTGGTGSTGGLRINSNGFNLTVPKILTGLGGVVKSGSGSLTLNGANTYAGSNNIIAGNLTLNADGTGTGDITVASGASFGVKQTSPANGLDPVNFTTTGATTLNLDLGSAPGTPTAAPLNVTGTLSLGGTVVLNVADTFPAEGNTPLVSYVGPTSLAANFVLGTLPNGVEATLDTTTTPGLVFLNITNAALPKWDGTDAPKYAKVGDTTSGNFVVTVTDASNIVAGQKVFGPGILSGTTVVSTNLLQITLDQAPTASAIGANLVFTVGTGTLDGVWDVNTTANWIEQIASIVDVYSDPSPVLFNDSATGPTAVLLDSTVAPSDVVFNNSTLIYSLSGTGKITGPTDLTKSGTQALDISTANDYTGVTTLAGGITSVAALTNGGVASPLGAATSAPENLVLAGGTLDYTGGAASIDRGLSIAASGSGVVSGLTLASDVTTTGQISATLGKLNKSGPGTLTLSNTGANILANGSGGETPQALRIAQSGLVLNGVGQTNTVGGWAGFGTTASVASGLTLANGASLTVNGRLQMALGAASTTSLTISDNSALQVNDPIQIGLGAGSVSTVLIEDSGSLTKTGGWFSLGHDNATSSTMTVRDSGSFNGTGGDLNIGDTGSSTGTLNLEDDASVVWDGFVFVGKNTTTGFMNMSGTSTMTCVETDVGYGNTSEGTMTIGQLGVLADTPAYSQTGRFLVGRDGGSTGILTIQGTGSLTVGSYTSVGMNGGGTMFVKDSGSFTNTDDFSINENGDVPGAVTVEDNGTLTTGNPLNGNILYVGRNDNRVGTLTIEDNATVTARGTGGTRLAQGAGSTGTVNLNGGTLVTRRITAGTGNSTFIFHGGVLKAGTGSNLDFLNGLGTVKVGDSSPTPGNAIIDTNGETIAISQSLSDGNGNLIKQGLGTLRLNGSNSYVGTTTVAAGTLGGTGSVGGAVIVPSGSTIAPGAGGVGAFYADDQLGDGSSIGGTYICEISGGNADSLGVGGVLDLTGATIDFDVLAAPAATSYTIASFLSKTGTPTIVGIPDGFQVVQSASSITLELIPTPYTIWADSFGLNPLTDGAPGADADDDGQANGIEFALGGSPISGSDNAKTFSITADSNDGGTDEELLLTIAVREGTPAFIGSPSPTATQDGAIYTIEGSTTLGSFTTAATPVTVVAPASPNDTPPDGYEWRTFSLSGSNGLTDKGFLRVKVSN
ncbi:MAG: autotransporter-associated beta strand repeat-containing protein [Verrucomicrobiota bacterium]